MTAVGKIMVFINLLFSLVVAAFIVMVHIASTNWADNYKKLQVQYEATRAEALSVQAEAQEARNKATQDVEKLQGDMKKMRDDLAQKENQVKALNDQLTAARDAVVKGDVGSQGSLEAVKRHQEEVKRFTDQVAALNGRVTASLDEQNKLRDRAVAAEIENRSLKDRNKQLVGQVEDMGKENIRLKNSGGSTAVTANQKNPPLENIEGVVMKADTGSGLLTLSIGSDAGLTKGHTLEVFRLSPTPKYLGTVRIVDVTAQQAVARPITPMPAARIQQGDRVASKILGS